ncbi:MAG: thioredoxin [Oscillospiraceae bacterium]
MAVKLNKDNFEAEVLAAQGVVVTDFYSDSCIPCKKMAPVIAALEEETDGVKFAKLNVNFDTETAEKYGVTSVPTLIFFKNGEEKARLIGAQKKTVIEQTINDIR